MMGGFTEDSIVVFVLICISMKFCIKLAVLVDKHFLILTEQQISCVSAYFTPILKAKTQLFSKLCVSCTLDIFLIPNCEFLPSVSFVYNQNGACIKCPRR